MTLRLKLAAALTLATALGGTASSTVNVAQPGQLAFEFNFSREMSPEVKEQLDYAKQGTEAGKSVSGGYDVRGKEFLAGKAQLEFATKMGKQWLDIGVKGREAADAWKPLSDDDDAIIRGHSSVGMPNVPSSCPRNSDCRPCYSKAQAKLRNYRYELEKLRAIGAWTDNFTKRQIAFGDSIAGATGIGGIAWMTERDGILQSFARFKRVYNERAAVLVKQVELSLRDLAVCEATYFNDEDWYDRYGFMYVSFMGDRYRL